MRVLIAPDKFKACLTAPSVAAAIAAGVRAADPSADVLEIPMADGGEGTVDALVAATGGRTVTTRVTGPLPGMSVDAAWGMLGGDAAAGAAVIEMAAASGLALLRRDQYDPLKTSTFGTGELIMAAVARGAKRIILGIGGSATTDGGVGCAQACGLRIGLQTPAHGTAGPPATPLTGADLPRVISVQPPSPGHPLSGVQILVASDVTNPLCGPAGAAAVFGPQKGASPDTVRWLDRALDDLATRTGQQRAAHTPGAGAAGGLGFGLLAFFGATLRSGFDVIAEAVRLREKLVTADLVFTGEGRLDASSLHGKTAVGVARLCKELGVPCVALAGAIGDGADAARDEGLTAYFSVADRPMTLEESTRDAARLLAQAAANVKRLFRAARPTRA
jgi:glycerate kinase